ncbi:MAG: molybdopterin-synthase adenylyltransferase MoeB [Acidobacteria bacterium]|nr:molybdopterin-synthase adenylyltransferase MoeB [Acidobacteriota bacterium]
MSIIIRIPSALRRFTGESAAITTAASTVGEALSALVDEYPNLRTHLYTGEGALRSFVNVFVNDEDIRHAAGLSTPLTENDEVHIVPSIAGGSAAVEPVELSVDEIQRYSRHLLLPEVGIAGQRKLKAARVLLVGAGGLGSPLAMYLAAAGVGHLGIIDFDVVDHSNLQRQLLHGTKDVGRPKLESARDRVRDINPFVEVEGYEAALTASNALDILRGYDVVADGTDNFQSRYLVNDACVMLGIPNVYGSIFRFEGQASVFDARTGPCYRCLYPEPPPPGLVPSCAEGGVLGVLPGIVGSMQAIETIKLVLGQGSSLVGRLLLFDALDMRFRELKLRKNPACNLCGPNPTVTELVDYDAFCGIAPGPTADEIADVQARRGRGWELSPLELKAELDGGHPLFLLDVREPHEVEICSIPGTSATVPVGTLADRIGEIPGDAPIVTYCRSGVRSAKAFDTLRAAGLSNVRSLRGGILAWSRDIDPSVPQY